MSSLKKELPWQPSAAAAHPLSEAARHLAAGLLLVASASLARVAAALTRAAPSAAERTSDEPRFEFHAEAGAPEGALYVDGELVGRLPGVRRL
ncbi:MAG: hypothetical protein M3Z15_13075 [Pseudomonadota bacterium]|nr:hypothetical protein [Pseudomonadota bacterium]